MEERGDRRGGRGGGGKGRRGIFMNVSSIDGAVEYTNVVYNIQQKITYPVHGHKCPQFRGTLIERRFHYCPFTFTMPL